MRANWNVLAGPWETVRGMLSRGEMGNVVAVNVQEIIVGDSVELLKLFVEKWKTRLSEILDHVITECVEESSIAVSVVLKHDNGCIARLFADVQSIASSAMLKFEIIGTTNSVFYDGGGNSVGEFTTYSGQWNRNSVPLANELDCPDKKSPINLGIISLEHPHAVGNHIPALDHLHDIINVLAIADSDTQRCIPFIHKYDAIYYPCRDELLADENIDAVLITSRNCNHSEDVIAAARAGKDIFCDKPIATTLADTLAIVDAIKTFGVKFITTFPVRFHPAVQELRALVDSGELGDIVAMMATNHGCMYAPGTPPWVCDPKSNGGGCIIDHTVHVADVIRYLTGFEFGNVQAVASTGLHDIQAEDIAVLQGRMTNGALFQIDCSWSRKATDPLWGDVTFRMVGTHGAASLNLYNNSKLEIFSPEGVEYRYHDTLCHQHAMIYMDYYKVKTTGAEGINADAIDGLRTMELVFAAYESIANNGSLHKISRKYEN